MCASLSHKNRVSVRQFFYFLYAFNSRFKIAAVPGHQNGKRGERNVVRNDILHPIKRLGVGDDQAAIRVLVQDICQFFRLAHTGGSVVEQNLMENHLLRKNNPSLRGLRVHGNNQNDSIIFRYKIIQHSRCPDLLFRPDPDGMRQLIKTVSGLC